MMINVKTLGVCPAGTIGSRHAAHAAAAAALAASHKRRIGAATDASVIGALPR
jgi:hypothetical protein